MNYHRGLLLFILITLPFAGWCQLSDDDRSVVAIGKQTNLQNLHQMLIKDRPGKAEQLRAFYVWTGHHIAYDVPASKSPQPNRAKQEPATVLRSGKAICHGYSRLLQELCRLSDIPCLLVNGYAMPTSETGLYGHTWNGVFLNGEWQLVDATWGAGGVDNKGRFVKDFSNDYFLPQPSSLMETHYPFDPAWQLNSHPISLKQWKKRDTNESSEIFSFRDTLSQFLSQSDSISVKLASTSRMVAINPDDRLSKQEHAVALLSMANFHQMKGNVAILKSNKKSSINSVAADRKQVLQEAFENYKVALYYYRQIKEYDSTFKDIINQAISSATNNIAYIEQELKR